MTIGADGAATVELALPVGPVGEDGVTCGRQTPCRVVALSDLMVVRSHPVSLSFSDAPTAGYDTTRLLTGILLSASLLVVAGLLIRSGDWRPPHEAAAPSIDLAEFADLDAEAEAFVDPDLPRPAPTDR